MSPPRLWTVTETSKLPDLSIVSDPDIDTYRYSRIDVESMSDMSAARQNKTKQHGGTLVEGQASGEPPT